MSNYCRKINDGCEYANSYGNCQITACNKTNTIKISNANVRTVFMADLTDGCIDRIADAVVRKLQEPERKTAEWVDAWRPKLDGTRYWFRKCSGCGFERDDCNPDKDTPHCPICGAKMCIGEKND